MSRKNNGFTLIELLAVIVILALIALISTPIVLNIINKSKKSAFIDTAYGIIESARLYYTEQILDGGITSNKEFKFDGSSNELSFNGTKPKGGSLILTSNGEISLAIHNGVWCASKAYSESKVTIKKYEESTCTIPDDIEVPDIPVTPEKPEEVSIEDKVNTSTEIMTLDPDSNPRYVGANPSNYVKFNDELWRIIGVFNGEAKIIRNEFYSTSISWDKKASEGGHDTYGYNDWSISTLQTELNGTYLNSINEAYKNMIDETHEWNLGGTLSDTSNYTRAKMYSNERGTVVYSGRLTKWIGAIGLMYASDYGYSTSATNSECDATMYNWSDSGNVENCNNNSWLHNLSIRQWTLSPYSDVDNYVFGVYPPGFVSDCYANDKNAVSPVLYLKSNVKITSGNGSADSPYELSI